MRPVVIGLTGSIGMGKSATAALFAERNIPVFDSDATVHRLYGGIAAPLIEAAFPGSVRDGIVDRAELGAQVIGDAEAMQRLEAIVHPLVQAERDRFLQMGAERNEPAVLLDIPLLYETGADALVDTVVLVSAPEPVQKARVLARPGMTPERFAAILAKQMPDAEKRRRADLIIETGEGFESARRQVDSVLRHVIGQDWPRA